MRIGFTASAFDLLHAGHILMLREAKQVCDYLICGLQLDPSWDRPAKNRPIQSITERYIQLSAVRYVDEIVPYTTEAELLQILKAYPIDVRILGEEYRGRPFTGAELDIPCHFNTRAHDYSTTELRARIKEAKL
jgi:glycerol-3-phosphate cytidylyltransferase